MVDTIGQGDDNDDEVQRDAMGTEGLNNAVDKVSEGPTMDIDAVDKGSEGDKDEFNTVVTRDTIDTRDAAKEDTVISEFESDKGVDAIIDEQDAEEGD